MEGFVYTWSTCNIHLNESYIPLDNFYTTTNVILVALRYFKANKQKFGLQAKDSHGSMPSLKTHPGHILLFIPLRRKLAMWKVNIWVENIAKVL